MTSELVELTPAQKAKEDPTINKMEAVVMSLPQVEVPVEHRFTPGLYSRQILMKKGMILASKIHKSEHQFIISKGKYRVYSYDRGVEYIQAPYIGITKPGARRIFVIDEDTVLTTFHPTTETDPEVIESLIIEPHDPYSTSEFLELQRLISDGTIWLS